MRNELLQIGFDIHNKDGYTDSWSYSIIDERLIAYKHGKITNIQVQNIEKNLETIITQFEEMKKRLAIYIKRKRAVKKESYIV